MESLDKVSIDDNVSMDNNVSTNMSIPDELPVIHWKLKCEQLESQVAKLLKFEICHDKMQNELYILREERLYAQMRQDDIFSLKQEIEEQSKKIICMLDIETHLSQENRKLRLELLQAEANLTIHQRQDDSKYEILIHEAAIANQNAMIWKDKHRIVLKTFYILSAFTFALLSYTVYLYRQ